ncbi:MAG: PAS domain S-box protein [Methanolobus sp.]
MELYRKETDQIKSILKDNPRGLSVTDISRKIGTNRNTVAKYLEILRISGHIEMESVGTAKIYFLSQRIPISTLLDFSSDYIIVIDSELKVVQVNDKFSDAIEISKKELSGKTIDEILPPMISNRTLMEKINEALNGKELVEMMDIIINSELWFLKTKLIPSTFDDGERGVTLIMENITEEIKSQNLLKEEQEKLEKMVEERTAELEKANKLLKKEITERKLIEEKLHDAHEKAQKYLDIAGVLIAVTDSKGNITLINRKGLDILECDAEKAIGANIIETFVAEEEKEGTIKLCEEILRNESEISCEKHIITPYGKKKCIKWTNVSFKDKNGNMAGVVVSGEDITEQRRIEKELKENEHKYRLLANNTLDSIWQIDKDFVFTYANPGALNMLELDHNKVVGTRIQDHFPENEMKKIIEIIETYQYKETDDRFIKIETKIYDKKRNLIPIEIYAKKIFDEDGEFCGYQGTTRKKADFDVLTY